MVTGNGDLLLTHHVASCAHQWEGTSSNVKLGNYRLPPNSKIGKWKNKKMISISLMANYELCISLLGQSKQNTHPGWHKQQECAVVVLEAGSPRGR